MHMRRLGWAGIELTSGETTLVVDFIASFGVVERLLADDPPPLPQPAGTVDAALVTHLHDDHTDAAALAAVLADGGTVLRPRPATGEGTALVGTDAAERALREHELATDVLDPWDTRTIGPFRVTALPAVDGFGEPQVSWLIAADGQSVLHAGDTIFHGSWWNIAVAAGPIDVAFLPINGAVCSFPHRQPPSPFAAAMDPEQAAVAAQILGARVTVPMHYDGVHVPPYYVQVDDPAGTFAREAAERGLEIRTLAPGEQLDGVAA